MYLATSHITSALRISDYINAVINIKNEGLRLLEAISLIPTGKPVGIRERTTADIADK